ncbi:hypothetical protein [Membranihabitans maritimus]|uniref:hypothetical protein n=1 Tax=Membranihabitans maritimus TaxID=2904244 RepID=UPI001F1D5571|nr:hypothetical protein [Membranihabitans maritimus]
MLFNVFINLLMLFLSVTPSGEIPVSSDLMVETTTTGIGYGRPTAECDGTGVCFVSETSFKGTMEDNFGNARLTFAKSGAVSSIFAESRSMTKSTIEKHFSGKSFIMKDPYVGNLKMGGKSIKIKIPAGSHRIKKSEGGFLIQIEG